MKTFNDALRAADPLRREPALAADRERMRAHVLGAASASHAQGASATRMWRGRLVLTAVALILLIGAVTWRWSSSATVEAAVRFEVRLAEDQPGPGLQRAAVANSTRFVYLHPDAIVTNTDILASNVIAGNAPGHFWINVRFEAAATTRMRDATAGHIGRPVAILVDGEVVSAPTVKSAIGDSAVISGDYSRTDAQRIVDGMALTP
jgi:preprotein translocase subunit SecD